MTRRSPFPTLRTYAPALALATALWWPGTGASLAQASGVDPQLASEMAALRTELARLQARLDQLEARTQASHPATADQPTVPPAATAAALAPVVRAGPGLRVEDSSDPERRFRIGGRLHLDAYVNSTDERPSIGGTDIRRARVNVDGAARGWDYRVQLELSGGEVDLRDVYLRRPWGDATLTVGQFKPYRAMDELTSSNNLSVMERGFTSASGLFVDRQWQQGVGWQRPLQQGSLGISAFSLREDNTLRNEGLGAAARRTWAPLVEEDRVLHFGIWASVEDGGPGSSEISIRPAYGGRRGPSRLLAGSVSGDDFAQRSLGLEFAGRFGAFHWQSEWSRARLSSPGEDSRLLAAYLQAGWVYGGGGRRYEADEGVFGAMQGNGPGSWEAVARVDHIRVRNRRDDGVTRYVLGINHYLNDDLRLMFNLTRGEDRESGDSPGQLAMRVQYVF